jgi:hypothetical protein
MRLLRNPLYGGLLSLPWRLEKPGTAMNSVRPRDLLIMLTSFAAGNHNREKRARISGSNADPISVA